MNEITYPCGSCPDDECGELGCAKYQAAADLYRVAVYITRPISESQLPDIERRRIAEIFAEALFEAFGVCAARFDRGSFLEACLPEATP